MFFVCILLWFKKNPEFDSWIRPSSSDFLSKLWKNVASLQSCSSGLTLTVAMEKLTEPVSIKQTQSLPGTGISQCIFSPRFFWHLIWRGRQHRKNLGLAIRRATTHWLWNHRQVTSFLWTLLSSTSERDSFLTCTFSGGWSEEMALLRVTWIVNKWSPQGQYHCCHSSAGQVELLSPSWCYFSCLKVSFLPFPTSQNSAFLFSLTVNPHHQPFTSLQHIPGSVFFLPGWLLYYTLFYY